MAEMFREPDVDALMGRITPEQFLEWQLEFAIRVDEARRAQHEATASGNMAARARG